MLRSIVLSVFAIAPTTMPVWAADLPAHSRLGAVFAEPSEVTTRVDPIYDAAVALHAAVAVIRPLSAGYSGYYGTPKSYEYSPYYGSPVDAWASRLPYACGSYGYC